MIQKRVLMTLAVPVAAAVARFAATKLRQKGKGGVADKIEQVTDFVSPKQKKKGLFRR